MTAWKRNLLLVWIAQMLATAGFSFATPFIPFYIQEIGVSEPARVSLWVALYAAAGNLALLLSAPFWGFLSDIYGRRPMVLRACFVSSFLMPMMAFVPGVEMLVALRFLLGLFAGTVTASQILVASNTPLQNRGFALGALGSAVFGGQMAGTFGGGLVVDAFGFRWAFFISGLMLLVAGCLVLFGVTEGFIRTTSLWGRLRRLEWQRPSPGPVWLLLVLVFWMGLAIRFDAPFLPLLVETINGPERAASWTGAIASLCALMGMMSGLFLGWLADKSSPRRVAIWSAGCAGLLMIPQGLATGLSTLIVARIGMVFFAGGLASVFQIWLAKSTPDDRHGALFGWATSVKSAGWFVGSLGGGAVAMHLGVRWIWFCAAGLFLALVPLTCIISAAEKRLSRRLSDAADC